MKPVRVIFNPQARRGAGRVLGRELQNALVQSGIQCDLAETEGVGHAIELARQSVLDGCGIVVAAGGDGTANEVINGLLSPGSGPQLTPKLALFPIGSANDLADALRYPQRPEQVAQCILRGHTRLIDVGQAVMHGTSRTLSRYFGNNAGIGFEAKVTLESYRLNLSGVLLYTVAALRALARFDGPEMTATWEDEDGVEHTLCQPTLMISVGNSARTGGGFYLTPGAVVDDGLLDLAVARSISRLRVLVLLPKALRGRHTTDPAVTMARIRRLTIRTPVGVPVHLDGEVLMEDMHQMEIVIDPGRLEIVR